MLSAQGIIANIDAILSYLPLRPQQRMGLHLPLHYSYGLIGQCFVALRAGSCTGLVPGGAHTAEFLAEIPEHAEVVPRTTRTGSTPISATPTISAADCVQSRSA